MNMQMLTLIWTVMPMAAFHKVRYSVRRTTPRQCLEATSAFTEKYLKSMIIITTGMDRRIPRALSKQYHMVQVVKYESKQVLVYQK